MPTGKEAPKRKDGKTSFDRLIEYIKDPEKTQDQDREQPDVWAINCLSIDTAAIEMTSTAMQNKQSEGNAAYHAIITWPKEEVPTAEQAREAGLIALKELGFDTAPGGHMALISYHHDTQNPHIHICGNKIQPQTLKSLHIEWSHKTLHQACRLIEIKQGWSHQKGIKEIVIDADGNEQVIDSEYRNDRNKGMSQKALDVEKHSNMTSFERYIKDTVGPLLKEELKNKNTSWQNVHDLLTASNVKIVQRGGGFSFSDQPLFLKSFTPEQRLAEVERASKTHASASTAGSFARGAALVRKLGEFQPNQAERILPEIRYNAKAIDGVEPIALKGLVEQQKSTGMKLQTVANNNHQVSEIDQDKIRLKAIFDKAMAERRSLFQAKKEARKRELTDIKKKEDRELQDSLNDSRKRAHAANAAMPPEMKLMTTEVNDILRVEREHKKSELKAIQTARQKKFEEEFDAQEAKLQKHNSFHRWLEEQSKMDGEQAEIAAKRVYNQSKMREQILKEQKLDLGNETITCPASKRKTVIVLLVSQKLAQQGYKAYQNKDHVAYVKNSKVRFKDFGNNISVTFSEEDQTIRDALLLAQEKFGQTIKLKGNAEFQAKASRLAYEIGIKSIQSDNPQALEIFRALKEGRVEIDLAKQHADAITNGTTPQTKYVDFDNRDEWKKLDKEADLVKIAQNYGYTIQKQSGDAVRLVKDDQVLNINTGAFTDTFFMKNDLGRTISGTAQDFIRKEEHIGYSDAAEKLFMLNRKLSKETEMTGQTIKERDYDIAYVRHLFNEATNDYKKMGILNTKGLFKNDLSGDTRVSDKGEIFFAHRDVNKNIVGFEVKTLHDRPVWFVKGGAKGVFLANEIEDSKVERVVIVMDAIEAEAIKKLELKQNKALIEKTLYLSVGGSASQKQIDYLNKFKNAEIELHVSKDTKGFDKVIEKLEHSLNVKTIHAEVNPTARTAKLVKDREQQYRGLER